MSSFDTAAPGGGSPAPRKRPRNGPLFLSLGFAASLAAFGFGGPASAHGEPPLERPAMTDTSASVQALRTWVLATGNNHGQPFVIVDMHGAQAAVFDPGGEILAAAPVLLGLAQGDDSPAGIGDRPLASIGPEERITPAGRFSAQLGENLAGRTILWVDYDAAISLHPVATAVVSEHRQARLDSPMTSDNRISYGCINVPAAFYSAVILPLFRAGPGVVYVLPETRSLDEQFFQSGKAQAVLPDQPAVLPAGAGLESASLRGVSPGL